MLSNNEIISTPFHAENILFPFSLPFSRCCWLSVRDISAALLLANKQPSLTSSYFLDFLSFFTHLLATSPFLCIFNEPRWRFPKASFLFFLFAFSQSWHRLHFCLCSLLTTSYSSMPSPVAGKHTEAHRQPNPFLPFHSLLGNTTYGCSNKLRALREDTKLRNK